MLPSDLIQNNTDRFDSRHFSDMSGQQRSMLIHRLSELQRVCRDVTQLLLSNSSTREGVPFHKASTVAKTSTNQSDDFDAVTCFIILLSVFALALSFISIMIILSSKSELNEKLLRLEKKLLKQIQENEQALDQGLKAKKEPVSTYINLGDELDLVEGFLDRIQKNPAVDGHFLLLDGPPGTGKTSLVLNYLKNSGYPIHQWVRGVTNDIYIHQVIARTASFFEHAKAEAKKNDKTLQVMFIDEIHGVIPKIVTGELKDGVHSTEADNTAFLTEISALHGHRVVLIGATNFPNQLSHPILSRAGTNRIHFALPNETQRQQLLTHFFRGKEIEPSSIETLSKVAVGYSARELLSFVESIKEDSVTLEMMKDYFNRYAQTVREDFKAAFECAEIFMPSFEQENYLKTKFALNMALKEQFHRLQHECSGDPKKHTLLYGPPGGGKTTAVRIFAQSSGRILISVNAGRDLAKSVLEKIFARGKQLGRVIIFFDEMDRMAYKQSPHTAFLQTEMEGIMTNGITIIGATNYRDNMEPAILSRFSRKIFLPKLDAAALNLPIRQTLFESIQSHQEEVYFDEHLAAEMEDGAIQLATESEGLDWRGINAAIRYLLGDLEREKTSGYAGITYLRLQDICFSFYMMKIQEELTAISADKAQTATQYIRDNRLSFFPSEIPEKSVSAKSIALKIA